MCTTLVYIITEKKAQFTSFTFLSFLSSSLLLGLAQKMNYCSSLIYQKFNCNIYRDKNFDNAKSKDDLHHELAYVQKMSDSAQYMIISTSTCFFIVRFEDKCLEVGLLTNLNLMGVGINFTQGQFHWNVEENYSCPYISIWYVLCSTTKCIRA